MNEPTSGPQRVLKEELFNSLPPVWPEDVVPQIQKLAGIGNHKLVVLDDDPTGSQTVYDIPVLTEWSVESLCSEFLDEARTFFILTNSRSLPAAEARALNVEISRNLKKASEETKRPFVVISRSDSTLRGHFRDEIEALDEYLGPFHASLVIPFFSDGGRYTIGDIHYVHEGDWLTPSAQTQFAKDPAFGYRTSNLREWVDEKLHGSDRLPLVESISVSEIRTGGPDKVAHRLRNLPSGSVCVVNAASNRDIEVVALGTLKAEASGVRILYRSAASFVAARAGLGNRRLLSQVDINQPAHGGALIVVGSYINKTSEQLDQVLKTEAVFSLEVNVERLLSNERDAEIGRLIASSEVRLHQSQTVILFTSRKLLTGNSANESLMIGRNISSAIVSVIQAIKTRPRYILAKGGITSSDVAVHGLGVRRAVVAGQIEAGISVWILGKESRFPGMPYIVFPGNVGDGSSLKKVIDRLNRK